ncbi:P21-Rho-binding domain [Carpediemonas membranifera]|uniref:P21-Rho-binding domain n=1 Tax=Carpediemonas membranifera TaxID=201153 RepID=A0A8J6B778_9EUKA|nr:P21-Rho-binding domain [Carpediemonas membranifera]|eukprot:KAG9394217.1 P21-Rho-binding domain [Carpediemonas membranifera]
MNTPQIDQVKSFVAPAKGMTPPAAVKIHQTTGVRIWEDTGKIGAIMVVLDMTKGGNFLRVYDINNGTIHVDIPIVGNDFRYDSLGSRFHCAMDEETDTLYGFNFADVQEASTFLSAMSAFGPQKPQKQKKEKKKGGGLFGLFRGGQAEEMPELEIGAPTNFEHKSHISFDPETGSFDVSKLSNEMKDIFKQAGVHKKDLQSPETATMLFQVLQSEFSKVENKPAPPPPPAAKRAPPPPPAAKGKAPPPPPGPKAPAPPPAPVAPAESAKLGVDTERGSAIGAGTRMSFLDQIRAGKELKAVKKEEKDDLEMDASKLDSNQKSGMANAIAAAMAQRRAAMVEDEDDEDSDWD